MMHESFVVRLIIQTRPVLHAPPSLVKEAARYGWMMSTVRVMKVLWRVVHIMDGI